MASTTPSLAAGRTYMPEPGSFITHPYPSPRYAARHKRGPNYLPGSIVVLVSHLTGRSFRIRIPAKE